MNVRLVATIGWFETWRYLRDKVSLFTTVVMPVLLVVLIGASFGPAPSTFSVGVVDDDASTASAAFEQALRDSDLTVRSYESSAEAARDVRLGFLTAGLTLAPGFGAALASTGETTDVLLSVDATSSNGPAVAEVVQAAAARFAEQPDAVRVALTALDSDDPATREAAEQAAATIAAAAPIPTTRNVEVGTVTQSERNGYATAVPTQLTLFVFLNGLLAGMTLVEARRLGVARRIMSTPTGVGPHILGIGAGRWLLGLIQAVILLAIGVLAFRVDFGDPLAVGALVLVWTALAAAVGMLIGSLARTAEQVVAISVPLGIGLGMLGGSMWPLSVVPPFMRTIAHATPHAWANDAWAKVIDDGVGVAGIALELAVLVTLTAVLTGLAVVLLRRALSR